MSQCKGPGVGICEACSGNSKRAGLVSEHQARGKWWEISKRKYRVDHTGLSAVDFFSLKFDGEPLEGLVLGSSWIWLTYEEEELRRRQEEKQAAQVRGWCRSPGGAD